MPDPGLPPSAAKHVGGGGGIQDSPLKQEQTGKGKSQRKSSWRLLRFLEVFFFFFFYLPSSCLWVGVYMCMVVTLFPLCSESVSGSVVSDSLWLHGLYNLCPWNTPGKTTGMDSHSLFLGIFPIQGSNPVSHIAGRFFTAWATRVVAFKNKNDIVCLSLKQQRVKLRGGIHPSTLFLRSV